MNRAAAGRWSGAALLAGLTLGGGPSDAQDQPQVAYDVMGAYFAPKLGAQFLIQSIQVQGFPPSLAARIVSQPVGTSHLLTLGLAQGDVITRLDGIPVTNYGELDNHYGQTTVRFIKQGTNLVQQGDVFIPVNPGGPVPPPGGGGPLPP